MNSGRAVALGNVVLGAATLLRPGPMAAAVGSPGGQPDARIVRVLGTRQCLQGLVTAAVPTSDVLWLGSAVDTAHAASMAPLLLTRFRRAALISASIAVASAVLARSSRDS